MQSPPAIWTLEPQMQTQSGAASPGEHLVEWACGGLKAPAPAMAITTHFFLLAPAQTTLPLPALFDFLYCKDVSASTCPALKISKLYINIYVYIYYIKSVTYVNL